MILQQADGTRYNVQEGDRFRTKIAIDLTRWVPIGPSSWTIESSKVDAETELTYTGQDMHGSDPGPGFPKFKADDGTSGSMIGHDNWGIVSSEVMDLV